LKGGRRLLCANLADTAPADAVHDRAATPGLLAGHRPPPVAHGCGVAPATALGVSAEHRPLHATRSYDTAPGLSAEHGPLRATRGCGLVTATASGLLTRHRPLRATPDRDPAAAAGLRWTCDRDNF